MAYYRRLEDLGVLLRRIFATALDLPEDWFEDKWQRHTSLLSLVHYPAQEGTPAPGQLRAGAHADYGSFTMLQKDPGEASLQVLRKDGEWVDVVPPAGTFVINIGDQLAQWTNDRWVSTKHRVINPTGEAARRRRLSMAFFCQPDYDAAVAPLTRPDEEPRYAPTTAGEILLSKFRKSTGMEE
jgi:isopenicillin N synthase-like dioxygenase